MRSVLRTGGLPLLLLLFAAATPATTPARGWVLVVNRVNPVSQMSSQTAKELLLGQHHTWAGGLAVRLVEIKDSSKLVAPYESVTGKKFANIRAAWVRLVFSEEMAPPLYVADGAEARAAVAADPGAFAVIDRAAVDDSVKVVFEVPAAAH